MDPEMDKQPEKPMDPIQVSRLLLWLDEEHRKDKTELHSLRERLLAQGPVMDSLAAQVRDLAAKLAQFQTQTARLSPLEEALNQTKNQISQIKEQQARYQEDTDHSAQARKAEIEHLLKSRNALEQRIEGVAREAAVPLPRVDALSDDFKRVMAVFPQFEAIRQQVTALSSRLPVFEAEDRRSNDRLAALERVAEDLKNGQVRIQETHRVSGEEQRHLANDWTAQAQALQRRYEERTTALQQSVADRSKDQEMLITVLAQVEAVRHTLSGTESRLARMEEQNTPRETRSLRLQDVVNQLQQEQVRLGHILEALEQRYGDELPLLRKAAADQDGQLREAQSRVAELSLEQQRDRQSLTEVRKQIASQIERQERGIANLREFQEQTLREQANVLQQRIQEAQRLAMPPVRENG
jgi:chromosome segregation ATPase